MKNIIAKIQNSTILTILSTIFLYLFIIKVSKFLATQTNSVLDSLFELSFYTENMVFKLYMLILSIGFILLINGGTLKNFGFVMPKNINYLKLILITIGIAIVAFIVGNIVFMVVLNNMFPTDNTKSFPKPESFIEMFLTVWVWSTIIEEIFIRGLLQGFMIKLKEIKVWKFSLSIIISGLLFGIMHLGLINLGMGTWFVAFIVFNTTVLGFLAAYYREKTDSLIPPIINHFLFNLVGSLPFIIISVLGISVPK